jgi:UDP-N-acetylmuramate dehydrogenase
VPADDPTGRPVLLSSLTTLGLGGPAPRLITVTTRDELIDALSGADDRGRRALVIGGGSNLVVADGGVDVPVIRVGIAGFAIDRGPEDGDARLAVGAGEDWDAVVARVVDEGYTGLETLSGIPGSAGATPIQNVGAYGTEISTVLDAVEVIGRAEKRRHTMAAAELALGYRTSVLRGTDTAVVTAVRLRLRRAPQPVRYAELARALGVRVGDPAPAPEVRQAVLALRRSKGMVLDRDDPDTRSAGSFFTNPVLDDVAMARTRTAVAARLGPDVPIPTYPADHGTKLSAAWLIERAGFGKGFALPGSRVAISSKHSLALTNRGGGTTAELLELARTIRDGVRAAFAVTLEPEPMLVGVQFGGGEPE